MADSTLILLHHIQSRIDFLVPLLILMMTAFTCIIIISSRTRR